MKEVAQELFAKHGVDIKRRIPMWIEAGYSMIVYWESNVPGIGWVLKYFPSCGVSVRKDLCALLAKQDVRMIGCQKLDDML